MLFRSSKLDSYMASLGVNLGRITGGLSGLSLALMAGRLLQGGFRQGRSGTSQQGSSGRMNFGNGKAIPMSQGNSGFDMSGPSVKTGSGVAGMNAEDGAELNKTVQPGDIDDGFGTFPAEDYGMDNQNLPFGNPEESDDYKAGNKIGRAHV